MWKKWMRFEARWHKARVVSGLTEGWWRRQLSGGTPGQASPSPHCPQRCLATCHWTRCVFPLSSMSRGSHQTPTAPDLQQLMHMAKVSAWSPAQIQIWSFTVCLDTDATKYFSQVIKCSSDLSVSRPGKWRHMVRNYCVPLLVKTLPNPLCFIC